MAWPRASCAGFINLFGGHVVFGLGDETIDDAEQLDVPIHAFGLILAHECHRRGIPLRRLRSGVARSTTPMRSRRRLPRNTTSYFTRMSCTGSQRRASLQSSKYVHDGGARFRANHAIPEVEAAGPGAS
jgi:hypothetical protein